MSLFSDMAGFLEPEPLVFEARAWDAVLWAGACGSMGLVEVPNIAL
jgi:hypothetical protein